MRGMVQVMALTTLAIVTIFSPTFFPTTAPTSVSLIDSQANPSAAEIEALPIIPSPVIETGSDFFLRTGDGN